MTGAIKQKIKTTISEHHHVLKEHRHAVGFHVFLAIAVGVALHLIFPPTHANDDENPTSTQIIYMQEHASANSTVKEAERIDKSLMQIIKDEKDHFHIIPNDVVPPEVSIKLTIDSDDGYNVNLVTSDFEFAPKKIGDISDDQHYEGHASLYINDNYVTRIYGPNFHIPNSLLDQENNVILVTLNDNTHKPFTWHQQLIYDADTIISE